MGGMFTIIRESLQDKESRKETNYLDLSLDGLPKLIMCFVEPILELYLFLQTWLIAS